MQQKLLQLLSCKKVVRSMTSCLQVLNQLEDSKLFKFGGFGIRNTFNSVKELVSRMLANHPPKIDLMNTTFMQQVASLV
eukprot:5357323-Prorocentrum_lima.AAC.1